MYANVFSKVFLTFLCQQVSCYYGVQSKYRTEAYSSFEPVNETDISGFGINASLTTFDYNSYSNRIYSKVEKSKIALAKIGLKPTDGMLKKKSDSSAVYSTLQKFRPIYLGDEITTKSSVNKLEEVLLPNWKKPDYIQRTQFSSRFQTKHDSEGIRLFPGSPSDFGLKTHLTLSRDFYNLWKPTTYENLLDENRNLERFNFHNLTDVDFTFPKEETSFNQNNRSYLTFFFLLLKLVFWLIVSAIWITVGVFARKKLKERAKLNKQCSTDTSPLTTV